MGAGGGEQWKQVYAVGFAEGVNREGREARREQIDRVVRGWKAQGMFKEVLGGEFLRLCAAGANGEGQREMLGERSEVGELLS